MPRHDPLPRGGARRRFASPPISGSGGLEIELLRDQLIAAERLVKSVIEERDSLRRQLIQAGIRPKARQDKPPARKRKPPEAGLAVPAVPPRGPLPLQGGAAAPLEFDD